MHKNLEKPERFYRIFAVFYYIPSRFYGFNQNTVDFIENKVFN